MLGRKQFAILLLASLYPEMSVKTAHTVLHETNRDNVSLKTTLTMLRKLEAKGFLESGRRSNYGVYRLTQKGMERVYDFKGCFCAGCFNTRMIRELYR